MVLNIWSIQMWVQEFVDGSRRSSSFRCIRERLRSSMFFTVDEFEAGPIGDVEAFVKCSIVLREIENETDDACDAPMSVGVVNGLWQWRTLCASPRDEIQAIGTLICGA